MPTVLDLFAGSGGWSVACAARGLHDIGIDWDPGACATRRAAGFATINSNVAAIRPTDFTGIDGLVASPPCQPFSAAGRRQGMGDPRSRFVYQPMRFIRQLRPAWVAMEEVPAVLPVWQACAAELRDLGYATWTGVLSADAYGVAQTRRRAFLLASRRTRRIGPPPPTHTRYAHRGPRCVLPLRPWVSMADALGRGLSHRPAFTVTTAGNAWGGTHARSVLRHAGLSGRWVGQPGPLSAAEFGVLQSFPADFPWQGADSSVLTQIGNAVPPVLAAAVVSRVAVDRCVPHAA